MSGGVDSSVAACLLVEQGYKVIGLFMCIGRQDDFSTGADADRERGCCNPQNANDARMIARKLGIQFHSLDFQQHFATIIDHFADEYVRGRTPNPCILCNQQLKFGKLADYAQSLGASYLATGHYARIVQRDGEYRLYKGVDESKDQSYALFGLDRNILKRCLFPVGQLTKEEVREYAERLGLAVFDKQDSQDICFAPDRDYARIVRQRHPQAFVEGPIVDENGREVGRHKGIANFTIGQRRGLGVAMGIPYYVTNIDPATNTVTIGPDEDLASSELIASRVNWLISVPGESFRALVKIRYAHAGEMATIIPLENGCVRVIFDCPVRAITPGQAAVFYNEDVVVGGGWIENEQP